MALYTDYRKVRAMDHRDALRVVGVSIGELLAGRYRVGRVLGSGGMGVVVSARDIEGEREVAVKLLRADLRHDGAEARFLQEARAARAIDHPGVVKVLDVGSLESGAPYMVMEYLRGDTLAALLEQSGPLPVGRAVSLLLQACEGVGAAHALGIIHRDLKPANLFCVRASEGADSIKLLDFGVSKWRQLHPTTTSTSSMLGSPAYMSPEQIHRGKPVDARTDVWGLGVTLYQLISGRLPFPGANLAQACVRIVTQPTPPLMRADAPAKLERVIATCLEKDSAKRFPSAEALHRALSPFMTSPMTAAGLETQAHRPTDALRREPLVSTARDAETTPTREGVASACKRRSEAGKGSSPPTTRARVSSAGVNVGGNRDVGSHS